MGCAGSSVASPAKFLAKQIDHHFCCLNIWVNTLNEMLSPVSNVMDSPQPENGLVGVCRQESQARYMAENFTSAYIVCIIVICRRHQM